MLILAEKISKEKLNELDVLGETESFFEDMVKGIAGNQCGIAFRFRKVFTR